MQISIIYTLGWFLDNWPIGNTTSFPRNLQLFLNASIVIVIYTWCFSLPLPLIFSTEMKKQVAVNLTYHFKKFLRWLMWKSFSWLSKIFHFGTESGKEKLKKHTRRVGFKNCTPFDFWSQNTIFNPYGVTFSTFCAIFGEYFLGSCLYRKFCL